MINKEFGSDFHWVEVGDFRNTNPKDDFVNSVDQLFFSGRAALYHLLKYGITEKGWKKIYVPTYYCHEVYHFIENLDIQIVFYDYNPIDNQTDFILDDENSNVVLVVNYFGICSPNIAQYKQAIVIEDLTHDLSKIKDSEADYCFGSLRKILPVFVGGFLKSKHEKLEQLTLTPQADFAATQKWTGMFLKSKYLKGEFESKDTFRQLLIEGEQDFENFETYSTMPLQVVDYLKTLNVNSIINQKITNVLTFKKCLQPNAYFEIFSSKENTDYALILKFNDHNIRNEMRTHLIHYKIYPMVLWPNQLNEKDKAIEETLLFIHADFRHSASDIQYISSIINDFSRK